MIDGSKKSHVPERRSPERLKLGTFSVSTLSGKLALSSGALVTLLLGSSVIGSFVATEFKEATSDSERTSQMLRNHLEADMMHDALRGDVINALLAASENDARTGKEAVADLSEHAQVFNEAIKTNEALAATETEKRLLGALKQPLSDYIESASGIVKRAQNDRGGASAGLPAFREKFSNLETAMAAATEELSAQAAAAAKAGAENSSRAQTLMWVLLGFGLIAGAMISFMGRRAIISPILDMTDSLHNVARGGVGAQIEGSERIDEIGSMARAVIAIRERTAEAAADQAQLETENARQAEIVAKEAERLAAQKEFFEELVRMCRVLEDIAQGKLNTDIPNRQRTDEIGAMARAIIVLRDSEIARGKAAADLEMERKSTEETREANLRAEREHQERLRNVMTQLATGLSALAEGDLRHPLNNRFPDEYEKLRHDFNAALQGLRGVVSAISDRSGEMYSGARALTDAATQLSDRTESQAAALEETAAALDEITATVKRSTEGANDARNLVQKAEENSLRSNEVLAKTVAAMNQIQTSSNQIGQIIGVIEEISFQTNLLALNAGVEAARAGDAGRGFAVVAQEVRALAQRAADAAKEIKGLISESSGHVAEGSALVSKTSETLNAVLGDVAKIRERVIQIADSSSEQSTALHEVNSAINQMDQVTQRNAAMVEETTANSQKLTDDARELAREIEKFKLAEDAPRRTRSAA
jgi:methyl-accepting chemotaxis protein